MARGNLIRGNHRAQLHVKRGRWPHAIGPALRDCECAGRKDTSANLDSYGDWIAIWSDAQNLKTHLRIISIFSARSEVPYQRYCSGSCSELLPVGLTG